MFGVLKLGKLGASMKKSGFNPRTLFSASEPGAWYDPSDMSTLFQDSAGTTPVTAVEQPVGRILDKSGRGNHAFQATATSRPVLQQDASGRYYLSFDGVDDWMQTSSINFTSTDKMTVFAGVLKLRDVDSIIAETSINSGHFNGSIMLRSAVSGNAGYYWRSYGSLLPSSEASVTTGYSAPIPNVLTGLGNISGDSSILRINGSQVSIATADQGTGNYGNYPLYIGRRGGTTLPFNGHLYSLIVRGAQSTAQQISDTETWVNKRTGAY